MTEPQVSEAVLRAAQLQTMKDLGRPAWVMDLILFHGRVPDEQRRMFELGVEYAADPSKLDALAAEIAAAQG